MKILVTGSNGLTGSEAVKFFREKGAFVVGVDNNMRSYFFDVKQSTPERNIDIRDEKKINALFKKYAFDVVIHTAAQPSHDWAKKEPLTDFDINARGTLILLEATRKYNPRATFVFCSTDKVYGENMYRGDVHEKTMRYEANRPFKENLSIDYTLRSLFGCSKTSADIYVQEYGRYFGMNTVCFRLGCITGKNHAAAEYHGFLAYLVRCIKEGKTYRIFGYKGKQVRDQIHAYDLVNAMWHFIQNPKKGAVYNLGGGRRRSLSILSAIKKIEKKTGKVARIEYLKTPRSGDRIWDIHDCGKFMKDYPKWKYKYTLNDILDDLCK